MTHREYLIEIPKQFNCYAKSAAKSLDGAIFAIGNKLVFTDATYDTEEPLAEFDSFDSLEAWLSQLAVDKLLKKDRNNG